MPANNSSVRKSARRAAAQERMLASSARNLAAQVKAQEPWVDVEDLAQSLLQFSRGEYTLVRSGEPDAEILGDVAEDRDIASEYMGCYDDCPSCLAQDEE